MSVIRILLIALAVALALHLLGRFKRLDPGRRKRFGKGALGVLVAAVAIVLLARFGLHWLGVAGAAAWGVLRAAGPLVLRLLPFLGTLRRAPDAGEQAADAGAGPRSSARGPMTRAEALEVLNLKEGASREEIMASYKNLMRKVHPDTPFGSNYLASQVNQAKDVLLG